MSNKTERLVRRTVRITLRRPEPPREVRFDTATNLLSWQAPRFAKLLTHYRIRIGSDSGAPTYEVSAGTSSIQLTKGITKLYISSYNEVNGLESALVDALVDPTVFGGNVTYAPAVTAFSVACDYAPDNTLRVRATFTRPNPLDHFARIHLWGRTPANAWVDCGFVDHTGEAGYTSETPATSQIWDFYAPSVSDTGVETPFDRAAPGSTPYCTATVPARPGGTPVGPAPDAALNIVSSSYDYSVATAARDRFLQLHVTYSLSSGSLEGVRVYYRKAGATLYSVVGDFPYSGSGNQTVDILGLAPVEAQTAFDVVLCPYANGITLSVVDGTVVTIQAGTVPNPNAGKERCENVTQLNGNDYVQVVEYFYDSSGTYKARLRVQFAPPNDRRWSGVALVKLAYDLPPGTPGRSLLYDEEPLGDFAAPGTCEVSVPARVENWDLALLSYNGDGERNTFQTGITPTQAIAIGSASGTFDLRKYDPSTTLVFDVQDNRLVVKGGAALEVDPVTGLLRVKAAGIENGMVSRTGATKLVIVNGDLAANSVLANNIVSGAVSTRHLDASEVLVGGGGNRPGRLGIYNALGVNIGFIGVNGLRTGYVNGAQGYQSGSDYFSNITWVSGVTFAPFMVGGFIFIDGVPFVVSSYYAPTYIVVRGYQYCTGSNVSYGSGSGDEGGWFKTLSVGGTDYANGKLKADANGNVAILDGTLALDRTELDGVRYTVSINQSFSADYGVHTFTGLKVERWATQHHAVLINRGLVCRNPAGWRVAACVSYNDDNTGGNAGNFFGVVWAADAAGNILAEMSANVGGSAGWGGIGVVRVMDPSHNMMAQLDNTGYAHVRTGFKLYSRKSGVSPWEWMDSSPISGHIQLSLGNVYNSISGAGVAYSPFYIYVDRGVITGFGTTPR